MSERNVTIEVFFEKISQQESKKLMSRSAWSSEGEVHVSEKRRESKSAGNRSVLILGWWTTEQASCLVQITFLRSFRRLYFPSLDRDPREIKSKKVKERKEEKKEKNEKEKMGRKNAFDRASAKTSLNLYSPMRSQRKINTTFPEKWNYTNV